MLNRKLIASFIPVLIIAEAVAIHWQNALKKMNKMSLKILVGIISIVFSFGLTLMIKPHIGVYVKSEIILNILLLIFTIVGFGVIYNIIDKNILKNKKMTQ